MINKKRQIELFCELVKIDSPTGEEKAVSEKLSEILKKMGAKVVFDNFGNVIATFKGEGDPFMLNAHMDTVEPGRGIKPIVTKDKITSDGTTILGSDPKAGISIILEALQSILDEEKKLPHLEIVFTRSEEEGLFGALNLDYSKVKSKRGLTFDGDASVANSTVAAPGYDRVDVIVTGKAAHAGVEPEKGVSAIKIVAEIISQLKVGRIDFETTANIGLLKGGSARNAIPETAEFKAEVRSRNMKKLAKHTSHFKDVFAKAKKKYSNAKIDVTITREFNSYKFSPNHPVLLQVIEAQKSIGLKPRLHESGGGTDVNIFHTNGIEAIVMGTAVYNAHTKKEYVKLDELFEATEFLVKFLGSSE